MKILYTLILGVFLFSCGQNTADNDNQEATNDRDTTELTPDQLIGAWETSYTNEQGEDITVVAIITDQFISATAFNKEEKKFFNTSGGAWKLEGNKLIETYEFNPGDPSMVGETETHILNFNDETITVEATNREWSRIDDGEPGALAGAWLITGRERDGEMGRRTPGARKTMKILSGERFQWIAYNTESGDFFGTGGGTYTTDDSTYTENIEFFSRDSSRVGASLEFQYEIDSNEWHHRGLSSKGDSIYEIWTPRHMLEEM